MDSALTTQAIIAGLTSGVDTVSNSLSNAEDSFIAKCQEAIDDVNAMIVSATSDISAHAAKAAVDGHACQINTSTYKYAAGGLVGKRVLRVECNGTTMYIPASTILGVT